ncbi:MAG: copper homeostasis protein CutC [Verrucomicrobiota bacterium]
MLLEMCIDSVESAIASEAGGAQRVEFCANLLEGGTTPSLGAIRETRRRIEIDLSVMVRPRGGDFQASAEEFAVMKEDIRIFKEEGVNCLVFGLLDSDGRIDEEKTAELIALSRPHEVTFHRAFDMTCDPFEALETLRRLGVDRILTSGQEPSVLEGMDLIKELHQRAGDDLVIMPGCGITLKNAEKIIREPGGAEVHVASPEAEESRMVYRNDRVFMGTALRSEEYCRYLTRADGVQAFRGILNGIKH